MWNLMFCVALLGVTVPNKVNSLPTDNPTTGSVGVTEVPILRPSHSDEVVTESDLEPIIVEAEEGTSTFRPETNSSGLGPFDPNDCFLPKSRGPCRAILDSFFFNTVTNTCEVFPWSGCGGNKNRFSTEEACTFHCHQHQKQETTTAVNQKATNENETMNPQPVTPSKPKHKLPNCPKFSGCGPKCVIIQDRSDRGCKKCICGEESVGGEGEQGLKKGNLPVPIITGTSKNVSKTTDEVSIGSVSGIPKEKDDAEDEGTISGDPAENCKLATKRGHCRGMMTRYHYDPALKDCILFHYGGCDGNLNNFVTKEKCLSYCRGQ